MANCHQCGHSNPANAKFCSNCGTPLQARIFGNARTVARWGSRLAPVSNWLMNAAAVRALGEWLLGLDRRRRLPVFQRRTLAHRAPRPDGPLDAILFNDTFTNHYDPDVGVAAIDVLAAAGIRVGLAPHGCCGRPQISKGLLADARALARANTEALYPHAAEGRKIVFCEPSCLSALREDLPALVSGEERRRALVVARSAVLFEELLDTVGDRLRLGPGPARILLHGHCHQKAMGLSAPARSLLSRIPGSVVVELDAGCCGMAGSFGYTTDHFDVSRQMAERRLLPAVRSRRPDDVVVAAGTSCRHQVKDLTGDEAVHPAVLLRRLLHP